MEETAEVFPDRVVLLYNFLGTNCATDIFRIARLFGVIHFFRLLDNPWYMFPDVAVVVYEDEIEAQAAIHGIMSQGIYDTKLMAKKLWIGTCDDCSKLYCKLSLGGRRYADRCYAQPLNLKRTIKIRKRAIDPLPLVWAFSARYGMVETYGFEKSHNPDFMIINFRSAFSALLAVVFQEKSDMEISLSCGRNSISNKYLGFCPTPLVNPGPMGPLDVQLLHASLVCRFPETHLFKYPLHSIPNLLWHKGGDLRAIKIGMTPNVKNFKFGIECGLVNYFGIPNKKSTSSSLSSPFLLLSDDVKPICVYQFETEFDYATSNGIWQGLHLRAVNPEDSATCKAFSTPTRWISLFMLDIEAEYEADCRRIRMKLFVRPSNHFYPEIHDTISDLFYSHWMVPVDYSIQGMLEDPAEWNADPHYFLNQLQHRGQRNIPSLKILVEGINVTNYYRVPLIVYQS